MRHREISYEQFEAEFSPVKADGCGPNDGGLGSYRQFHLPEDGPLFASTPSQQLWTVLDCDGRNVIASGLHRVNREFYVMTEKPWEFGEAIDVLDPDDKQCPACGTWSDVVNGQTCDFCVEPEHHSKCQCHMCLTKPLPPLLPAGEPA